MSKVCSNFIVFKFWLFVFVFSLLFSNFAVFSSDRNFHPQIGYWMEYSVLNSSRTINAFYGAWPPGNFFGNWSVNVGDYIEFEVEASNEDEINGSITLGSTTFYHVRNIDVASALALSIYPWNGGFFVNVSTWAEIPLLLEGTNTTIKKVSNYEQIVNETNSFFTIELFETINYYGQNSTFKYDYDTGVLLYAYTSFGNYLLEISLLASNFLLGTSSQTKTIHFPAIFSSLFFPSLFLVYRRCKKKFS
ncbi:MAG: hypothetical protein ACTSUR_05435 [Candidatus Heimdallarchaeaceae archaeon]